MIDTMESKIQELLIASLPEQTAGMMKKFIEEANKLKEVNKELETTKKSLETSLAVKSGIVDDLKIEVSKFKTLEEALRKQEADLAAREILTRSKELDLDNNLLKKDVECARAITDGYHRFLSTLVKNPISEEYFFENKYQPSSYIQNSDGSTTNVSSGNVTHERKQRIENKKEI